MFLLRDTDDLVISASDLWAASECEFGLLRTLDEKLGRKPPAIRHDDPVRRRAAELGDRHEAQELARRVAMFGQARPGEAIGVREIARPTAYTTAELRAAHDETIEALHAGYPVVFQGCFFDGRFHGYADFLNRSDDGTATATYTVADTKLARTTRVPALLQIAAYADQLQHAGIPTSPYAELILGDNTTHRYPLADIVPVFKERWRRLTRIIDEHLDETGPVSWNDPRYLACGRCDTCADEARQYRDLLLVAGMRLSQRKKLRAHGIHTIDHLAAATGPVPDIAARGLTATREQAALQLEAERANDGVIRYAVHDPGALDALPPPSQGDIFFDFEGDPMWSTGGDRPGPADWGIEYLFGVLEAPIDGEDPVFRPFWAHDRAAERDALEDFMEYVTKRRVRYPDLHIYHYAAYEKAALTRLAARHGTCEDAVDNLLRAGVLVDLYAVVRNADRISAASYSIKSLEPLYMGDDLRDGDVTNATQSIIEYANYCTARELGDDALAKQMLQGIEDYNRYDCLSTLRLRDWLLDRAREHGIVSDLGMRSGGVDGDAVDTDGVHDRLAALAGPPDDRTADQQAYAMLAAATGYNAREHKPFWWAHFDRLNNPVDEWVDTRDVFVVDDARVVTPWQKPTERSQPHRRTRLEGRFGTGSLVGVGSSLQAVYAAPVPPGIIVPEGTIRGCKSGAKIVERGVAEGGDEYLVVDETLARDCPEFHQMPMALVPDPPPRTQRIDEALREIAVEACSGLPDQPAVDLLRRRSPRLIGGAALPPVKTGSTAEIDAIHAATRALDSSYVAVQGPPGTGKTHIGARVVRRLVEEDSWRIGIVAQSHAVVEHFLGELVEAGLDPALVAKKRQPETPAAWTCIRDDEYASYLAAHARTGCVVGGTAWDFANTDRIGRRELDLLLVDEAGQFALATTLAASVSATRLLLLGDPRQLPQVSQGCHPEPVDESALGWLVEGHATLPSERGYFLDTSWRMHPSICARVSTLSYDGQLHARSSVTRTRSLQGVVPGVEVVVVPHRDNAVSSIEEADGVVAQVRALIGRQWADGQDPSTPRALEESDILVVAPYNAQVNLILEQLTIAGFPDVPVGSVDKFQGRQAAVVIVSMTASARDEIPRGIGFLLNRNRVNVSVSRGQWKSIIIRSDVLTDFTPNTPAELLELGAFIGLCEDA
jgi:predicted RecB family nuclease